MKHTRNLLVRSLILITAIVLLFGLTSCSARAIAPAVTTTITQPQARTLSVSGNGTIALDADIARVTMSVSNKNEDAVTAVDENNAATQALIDAIREAGVGENDISTTNFSIWQTQQYDSLGTPFGLTYQVDNTVNVTVSDIEMLGYTLDAAVSGGATNINSVTFDRADKTQAMMDARAQAVVNAKALAEELAAAAGVKLGNIISITYTDDSLNYPVYRDYGMGGGGASSVPISPSDVQVSATVNIVYAIE